MSESYHYTFEEVVARNLAHTEALAELRKRHAREFEMLFALRVLTQLKEFREASGA